MAAYAPTTTHYDGNIASGNSRNHYGDVHGNVTVTENHYHQSGKSNFELLKAKNALFVSDPRVQRASLITAKGDRVTGTCEWILQNSTYRKWCQGDISTLWISGGPGKGKTMISIFLSEQLEDIARSQENTVVIYCFCKHQELYQNGATDILRTLLWHLISQRLELITFISAHLESDDRAKSSLGSAEALWIMLGTVLNAPICPEVVCVLDGLDECDETSKMFLASKIAQEAKRPKLAKLQMVLISRDIPRLRRIPRISLDPDHNDEIAKDIDTFIESRVDELSDVDGFEKIRTEVQQEIAAKAASTFLWVGFAMHELLEQSTCSEIMRTLRSLPPGLDAIYRRMLEQIPRERRDRAARALRWVAFAVKPLLLGELFVILELQCEAGLDWEQCIRDEIALCGPILRIGRSNHFKIQDNIVDPSREEIGSLPALHKKEGTIHAVTASDLLAETDRVTLQDLEVLSPGGKLDSRPDMYRKYECHDAVTLIHQSANDFLRALELRAEDPLRIFRAKPSDGNLEIVKQCVRTLDESYLNGKTHGRYPRTPDYQSILDVYGLCCAPQPTLLHYAVEFWPMHSKLLSPDDSDIWRSFKFFSADSRTKQQWLKTTKDRRALETPLEFASCLGILPWARSILQSATADNTVVQVVNSPGSQRRWTPLWLACLYNHVDMLQLLLKFGADPSFELRTGITPLSFTVERGRTEMVRLLLQSGADVNARQFGNLKSRTLLHLAVNREHIQVVRLLVKNGADVNTVLRGEGTPLHTAARYARAEIAQLLLENGADVNLINDDGATALDLLHQYQHNWTPTEEEELKVLNNITRLENLLIARGATQATSLTLHLDRFVTGYSRPVDKKLDSEDDVQPHRTRSIVWGEDRTSIYDVVEPSE